MTTRDDEAQQRRTARLAAAGSSRIWGLGMMIGGGVFAAAAITAFALSTTPEIQSWIRQAILTGIVILFTSGVALHAVGRSSKRTLAQLADDREELMQILLEIKRRQTFLMGRPGTSTTEASYRVRPPSQDTLDMVRRKRLEEEQRGEPPAVPKQTEGLDLGKLLDQAEWFNLGAAVERRKHDPDDTGNN